MPTLEAVWRAVFPAAQLFHLVPQQALERQVAWVRVLKARVPAFDALEPDDLAIVPRATLDSLAALAVEPARVVEAVADARGCGILVLSDGDAADGTVHEVLERAAALGLGALIAGEAEVWALERSAIAYIVNGRAELERRAAGLEAELEQVALAGGGPEGLAATIARFLARSVAIEGVDGSVLAVHAPVGAGEDASAVGEYLRRRRGAAARVALPAAGDDAVLRPKSSGALVLLGKGEVSELERMALTRVAALVALELGRGAPVASTPSDRASDALPADGPPWVALVARQIDGTAPTTLEERERLRRDLRRAEPARRLGLRGDATSVELRLVAAAGSD
ncbi:MAG TPA: hypothetical protein VK992_00545, partial [Candidatus Caenarcaniphilales bacterium]|nr:hypothetical protein [Candidatus Caenarcaniphilales bacterium]